MLSFSKEAAKCLQNLQGTPKLTKVSVCDYATEKCTPGILFPPEFWLYPLICFEEEAGPELILNRNGRETASGQRPLSLSTASFSAAYL